MSFENSFSCEFGIGFTCGAVTVRFVPTLTSQSTTVKQGNDDANYGQNGQHSDNDHAVTALYIRVEIANLPPDLSVRKALFVFRFFMLNMFLYVESPRRPDEMDAL
jgi:hypothetical protein